MILGTISLILGTIGILLPIIPTTPFILLSGYFYIRSSKKIYEWLLNNKIFGKYISNYVYQRSIPIKTKIYAVVTIWISIPITVFLINNIITYIVLPIIAIIVTTSILRLKTLKK
ncbi:MAG: YbaN family protein [Bacilli bacterium]